jgi:protein-S-isoprenylcysteine O-methyltransferase Ste14
MADGQSYFLFLLIFSIIAHLGLNSPVIIVAPFTYPGIILIVFGLWLCYWTRTILVEHNTTLSPFEKPTTLVTTGPFQFSRNPVYLGMAAILTGTAIFMGTAISFIPPLLFIIIIEIRFIRIEEQTLERVFGQHFRQYKRTVRKWI